MPHSLKVLANRCAALPDDKLLLIVSGHAGSAIAVGDLGECRRLALIMGHALQSVPAVRPAAFAYERRRPEETTLYQVVQEQLETFLAQVEAQTGSHVPAFVKDEFEAFLEYGILAHRFLRVRCADCAPRSCRALLVFHHPHPVPHAYRRVEL